MGGSRTLSVNFRVIAATNKQLPEEISKGNFREDLYYRVNVIPVEVPALRERSEDIPLLVETFLKENADQGHCEPKQMAPEALELLKAAPWPGNVRELKNLVERLSIMVKNDIIKASDLPVSYNPGICPPCAAIQTPALPMGTLEEARRIFEEAFIREQLVRHNQDLEKAAAAMGLSVDDLRKRTETQVPRATGEG
jgi:two-component system nitrogen regulation response regulator NtrX